MSDQDEAKKRMLENRALLRSIDGQILQLIQANLKGAKDQKAVVHAFAHALIYQGAQCAQRIAGDEFRKLVNSCVEASFKQLDPDRIIPAKSIPLPPQAEN